MTMERDGGMYQVTQRKSVVVHKKWGCGERSENQDAGRKRTLTKMLLLEEGQKRV